MPKTEREGKIKEEKERKEKTHLCPRMCLDLRELELGVVFVHFPNLFLARRSENLDDLDELVDAGVTGEDWLTQQKFS